MNIENAGYGAGGSFLGAVLAYLGFKQRIDRIQHEVDKKVNCCTFNATIDAMKETHKSMDKKLDILIENSTK